MRGIFTAGVLDRLLELELTRFDVAIGTSAGACNLVSFIARQHGRNLRLYLNSMSRPEFLSVRRALRGGHYMDLDWLWERTLTEDPLDEAAFSRSRTQLLAVATCAHSGEPIYTSLRLPSIHFDLKAGCALPFLYRGPVPLGERNAVDGGLTDPIPAAEAYRRGARRIVVVRTRPSKMVKRKSALTRPLSALLYKNPAVARASAQTAARYQEAVAWLQAPPSDATVVELAPDLPLKTKRTTQRLSSLIADYDLGRAIASRNAGRLQNLFTNDSESAQHA